jgi:septal ring factor EnvC (AmiA/AmiB activator)
VTTSPATPTESAPTEAGGATIIPFPVRKPAAPAAEVPPPAEPGPAESSPADRLARAMAQLHAALAEQQKAVATWRSVMAELKTSTTGLSASLLRYNASLGTLSDKVSAVHKQAQELEEWADCALATHGTPEMAGRI